MAFIVRVNWTPQGSAALTLLMQNIGVQDQSNFLAAVTDFARGWAAMKFSRFKPQWDDKSGKGTVKWDENGASRSETISIAFVTSDWQAQVTMTISITGVNRIAAGGV